MPSPSSVLRLVPTPLLLLLNRLPALLLLLCCLLGNVLAELQGG